MSSFGQNDFDGGDEKTTPLMAQIAEDSADDPIAGMSGGSGERSGLGSGMIVLLGVIVVAGGTLFMMRRHGQGPGLSMADVKIDYPIDQMPGSDDDHKRVLADLQTIDGTVQIPLGEVRQNPFEMVGEEIEPDDGPRPGETEAERRRREAEARRAKIADAFSKLQLQTVLSGMTPVARISGQTVRVGDTVGGQFTVVAIHNRSVDLLAPDDQTYTLTIGMR